MKISKQFSPITITLENEADLSHMKAIISACIQRERVETERWRNAGGPTPCTRLEEIATLFMKDLER